jgi:hypothetical protein
MARCSCTSVMVSVLSPRPVRSRRLPVLSPRCRLRVPARPALVLRGMPRLAPEPVAAAAAAAVEVLASPKLRLVRWAYDCGGSGGGGGTQRLKARRRRQR